MRRSAFKVMSVLLALALVAASCTSSDDDDAASDGDDAADEFQPPLAGLTASTAGEQPELLFAQRAGDSTVTEHDAGLYELTLSDVEDSVTSFTDRPLRDASTIAVENLVALWDQGATFATEPPNVALDFQDDRGERDMVVVQILEASMDGDSVTYVFLPLTDQDPPEAGDHGPVTLFIDSASDGGGTCRPDDATCNDFLIPRWTAGGGWGGRAGYPTIRTADLDGDGVDELFGRGPNGIEVFAFDSRGCGEQTRCGAWRMIVAEGPHSNADGGDRPEAEATGAGDFDGDGSDEIYSIDKDGLHIHKLVEPTDGVFGSLEAVAWDNAPELLPSSSGLDDLNWSEPHERRSIKAADIDGDGDDELVGRGWPNFRIWNLENGQWTEMDGPRSPGVHVVGYADLDGDGMADFYGWNSGCGEVNTGCTVHYWAGGPDSWRGNGEIALTIKVPFGESRVPESVIWSMTAADLDPTTEGLELIAAESEAFPHINYKPQVHVRNIGGSEMVVEDKLRCPMLVPYPSDYRMVVGNFEGDGTRQLVSGSEICSDTEPVAYSAGSFSTAGDVLPLDLYGQAGAGYGWPAPMLTASVDGGDVLLMWERSGVRTLRLEDGTWERAEPVPDFDAASNAWSDQTSDEAAVYAGLMKAAGIATRGGIRNAYDASTRAPLDDALAKLEDAKAKVPDEFTPEAWNAMADRIIAETTAARNVAAFFAQQRVAVGEETLNNVLTLETLKSRFGHQVKATKGVSVPWAKIVGGLVKGAGEFIPGAGAIAGPILGASAEFGMDKLLEEIAGGVPEEVVHLKVGELFTHLGDAHNQLESAITVGHASLAESPGLLLSFGSFIGAFPDIYDEHTTRRQQAATSRAFDEMAWAAVGPLFIEAHDCQIESDEFRGRDPLCPWHLQSKYERNYVNGRDVVGWWVNSDRLVYAHVEGTDPTDVALDHLTKVIAEKLFSDTSKSCSTQWSAASCNFGYTPKAFYQGGYGWALTCWNYNDAKRWFNHVRHYDAPCVR